MAVAGMDNMLSVCTQEVFEEQCAGRINFAPALADDPTFDWHSFKDFLLKEENFEVILNALQFNLDAQRSVHQPQFYQPTNGVPEASFGGHYAAPSVTYIYQPCGIPTVPFGAQYAAPLFTYSNYAASISTRGMGPVASTSSTTSAPRAKKSRKIGAIRVEPQVYIKKPPNAFMLFLKEQRPRVRAALKTTASKDINAYLGAMWKSLSNLQKEKYYKEAEEQRFLHEEQNPGWSAKDNYGKKLTKVRKGKLGQS